MVRGQRVNVQRPEKFNGHERSKFRGPNHKLKINPMLKSQEKYKSSKRSKRSMSKVKTQRLRMKGS